MNFIQAEVQGYLKIMKHANFEWEMFNDPVTKPKKWDSFIEPKKNRHKNNMHNK